MKILDSDHCIAILRGQLNIQNRVEPTDPLFVTAISVAELTHGVYKSAHVEENLARLEVFLVAVHILPFDAAASRRCGMLKAALEQRGKRLADLDLQIASIALEADLPLVTHNYQHFKRIPGLGLEDWIESGNT